MGDNDVFMEKLENIYKISSEHCNYLELCIIVYKKKKKKKRTGSSVDLEMAHYKPSHLTLLHSEWPKLCRVLAILSAIGLKLFHLQRL